MLNIETLFIVHYNTKNISDDNFKKFLADHIEKLTTNNDGGKYNAMLADTTPKFIAMHTLMSDEHHDSSVRQGSTIEVDNIINEFKSSISQKEGLIRSIWGIGSPTYEEFFPHGLTEYNNASKKNVPELMENIIRAANDHSADLPPDFITYFTDLKQTYVIAREKQLGNKAKVKADKSQVAIIRQEAAEQINKNIHTLAIEFLGKPEFVNDFFDQSIIRRPQGEQAVTYEGIIEPLSVVVITEEFNENDEFELINTGTVPLTFCCSNNKNSMCNDGVVVEADDSIIVSYEELGDDNDKYLKVTNHDAATQGMYEVTIY